MVSLFGEKFQVEIVFAILFMLAICLLALKLRYLLLLTILALLLPSLQVPYSNVGRVLRWAFLAGLVGKGIFINRQLGLKPRDATGAHHAVLLLSVLIIGSSVYSFGREITLAQGTMMVLLWSGVFLVLWNSWEKSEDLLDIATTLFYVACLIFTLETLYASLGLGRVISHGRYAGIFKNPNGLGTAAAFLGPFVYWKHWSTKKPGVRLWCKVLGILMIVSLYRSGSRSGSLGAVVCMGMMITWVHRVRAVIVVGIVGVPMLLFIMFGERLDPLIIQQSHLVRADSLPHLSDRLPDWKEGFSLFLERPFLGYGYAMNKFAALGRANFALERALMRTGAQNYHNTHLQLAMDLGIVGLGVFWFFLAFVYRKGAALYASSRRGALEMGGMAFFAAFLALTGDTFVHGWGFSPGSSVGIVYWTCAAAVLRAQLLSSAQAVEEAREREKEASIYRLPVSTGVP